MGWGVKQTKLVKKTAWIQSTVEKLFAYICVVSSLLIAKPQPYLTQTGHCPEGGSNRISLAKRRETSGCALF